MKFTCITEVNLPVDRTAELFDNKDALKNWQTGFVSYTPVSGTPNQRGAKARIVVKNGSRLMELTETIISHNLPNEVSALYEHIHMTNTARNTFTALGPNKTRIETEVDYTKFNGIIPRLMSLLMPGMFKAQTQKWMDNFKRFAESGTSVTGA